MNVQREALPMDARVVKRLQAEPAAELDALLPAIRDRAGPDTAQRLAQFTP
jgi:hypothetical protein